MTKNPKVRLLEHTDRQKSQEKGENLLLKDQAQRLFSRPPDLFSFSNVSLHIMFIRMGPSHIYTEACFRPEGTITDTNSVRTGNPRRRTEGGYSEALIIN